MIVWTFAELLSVWFSRNVEKLLRKAIELSFQFHSRLSPPSRLALVHRTRWFNFYNLQIYGICLVSRFECEMSWSCILIAFHKLHLVRLPTRSSSCFDRLSTHKFFWLRNYTAIHISLFDFALVCVTRFSSAKRDDGSRREGKIDFIMFVDLRLLSFGYY